MNSCTCSPCITVDTVRNAKFVTWNLLAPCYHYSKDGRTEFLSGEIFLARIKQEAAILRELDADIIALQEVFYHPQALNVICSANAFCPEDFEIVFAIRPAPKQDGVALIIRKSKFFVFSKMSVQWPDIGSRCIAMAFLGMKNSDSEKITNCLVASSVHLTFPHSSEDDIIRVNQAKESVRNIDTLIRSTLDSIHAQLSPKCVIESPQVDQISSSSPVINTILNVPVVLPEEMNDETRSYLLSLSPEYVPVVLSGDFNGNETDLARVEFTKHHFFSAFRSVHGREPGVTHVDHNKNPVSVDAVLVRPPQLPSSLTKTLSSLPPALTSPTEPCTTCAISPCKACILQFLQRHHTPATTDTSEDTNKEPPDAIGMAEVEVKKEHKGSVESVSETLLGTAEEAVQVTVLRPFSAVVLPVTEDDHTVFVRPKPLLPPLGVVSVRSLQKEHRSKPQSESPNSVTSEPEPPHTNRETAVTEAVKPTVASTSPTDSTLSPIATSCDGHQDGDNSHRHHQHYHHNLTVRTSPCQAAPASPCLALLSSPYAILSVDDEAGYLTPRKTAHVDQFSSTDIALSNFCRPSMDLPYTVHVSMDGTVRFFGRKVAIPSSSTATPSKPSSSPQSLLSPISPTAESSYPDHSYSTLRQPISPFILPATAESLYESRACPLACFSHFVDTLDAAQTSPNVPTDGPPAAEADVLDGIPCTYVPEPTAQAPTNACPNAECSDALEKGVAHKALTDAAPSTSVVTDEGAVEPKDTTIDESTAAAIQNKRKSLLAQGWRSASTQNLMDLFSKGMQEGIPVPCFYKIRSISQLSMLDWSFLSDHRPVVVDMNLTSCTADQRPTV